MYVHTCSLSLSVTIYLYIKNMNVHVYMYIYIYVYIRPDFMVDLILKHWGGAVFGGAGASCKGGARGNPMTTGLQTLSCRLLGKHG